MAEIAKSGTPSLGSVLPPANNKTTGLFCGEDIAAGDTCYIKGSDGKVYRTNGTSANAAARYRGVALMAGLVAQNDAITIAHNIVMGYGATLTPGADYYASASVPGGLSDTATTGGTAPIAFAVDATRVFFMSPN